VNTRFGNDQNPFVPKIVEAQQAIAARDNCCAYVDTAGAEPLLPSRTHFTATGTLEVGQRFAAALLKLEAANAKQAAADAAIEAKYQALVASLPPAEQAWERTLQENLGGNNIAIDDLFTAITPHLAETQNPGDVHFNGQGYDFLGQTVATSIEQAMK